ncbi:MAG TPA: hypothetical protein VFO72_01405 [Pyrinomonadaceae bacterium]|nr:hypothetical protein [Pyrinomonadaceae bacterium]
MRNFYRRFSLESLCYARRDVRVARLILTKFGVALPQKSLSPDRALARCKGTVFRRIASETVKTVSQKPRARAYLVKKVCKHFPESPGYVLGVTSKRVLYSLQLDGRDRKLINQLAADVSYAGYTFIIPLEHSHKPLIKIFKHIEGAEIYRAV